MGIETHVTNGSNYRLSVKKWHVGSVFRIHIPSSNSKVDDIDTIFVVFRSKKYVSRLDISVHEAFGVDILNSRELTRKI
jgi:hypothetical protein